MNSGKFDTEFFAEVHAFPCACNWSEKLRDSVENVDTNIRENEHLNLNTYPSGIQRFCYARKEPHNTTLFVSSSVIVFVHPAK